jgi:ribosomal protein L22
MTDEKKITDDTQPTSSAGTGDQIERADEEAARAAAAADDAVEAAAEAEAAADAGEADPEVADEAVEAADEAVAAAEEAAEAAKEAAEAPKPKRARKARAAEVAADQADDAADEAAEAAAKAPDTQPASSAGTGKPGKRTRTRKKAEEEAAPVEETPAPAAEEEEPAAADDTPATAPAPRRRGRREAPVGLEVRAQARYVRTSARKARLVCEHIRGKDVAEARAILAYTPRSVAKDWAKLLESAVANAEHNHELVGEELKIASVYADEGPTLKRFRPRAMGRATRIRKRTSHLTITLTPKEL